jgi:hypothetical protein
MACGQNGRPALTEEFVAQTWRRPGLQGSARAARKFAAVGCVGAASSEGL